MLLLPRFISSSSVNPLNAPGTSLDIPLLDKYRPVSDDKPTNIFEERVSRLELISND